MTALGEADIFTVYPDNCAGGYALQYQVGAKIIFVNLKISFVDTCAIFSGDIGRVGRIGEVNV